MSKGKQKPSKATPIVNIRHMSGKDVRNLCQICVCDRRQDIENDWANDMLKRRAIAEKYQSYFNHGSYKSTLSLLYRHEKHMMDSHDLVVLHVGRENGTEEERYRRRATLETLAQDMLQIADLSMEYYLSNPEKLKMGHVIGIQNALTKRKAVESESALKEEMAKMFSGLAPKPAQIKEDVIDGELEG